MPRSAAEPAGADPDKRFESAQAVFKSREKSVLPALDAAWTRKPTHGSSRR
jgi:hypothetical protein